MVTTLAEPRATPGAPGWKPFEITADLFFEMIETGLIAPDRRVFLWGGKLYESMAKTVAHAATGAELNAALLRRLPDGWILWPENPIALDRTHAPLPDMTVIRGTAGHYVRSGRHPGPADVGLLVEIAVSSLDKDLGPRREAYARAMVPRYWVVDVLGRRVLDHAEPKVEDGRGVYGRVESYGPGQSVPLVLDGREIDRIPVEALLPS